MDLIAWTGVLSLPISAFAVWMAWRADQRAKRVELEAAARWEPSAKWRKPSLEPEGEIEFSVRHVGTAELLSAELDERDLRYVRMTPGGKAMRASMLPGESLAVTAAPGEPRALPEVVRVLWRRKGETTKNVSTVVTDPWRELLEQRDAEKDGG